ncbi:flavin reductase like domain-containing protein [Aspergillus varians]
MKLLHSRGLLSASRSVISCRVNRYTSVPHIYPLPHNPPLQWRSSHRSLSSNAVPSPSPTTTTDTNTNQDDWSLSLSTQIRLLMRQVPYPVAIITSTDPNPSTTHPESKSKSRSDPTSQFRGMTVSSFNTVTLTPQPVISFNVRRPSETLHALLSSGRFLVHLLATNQHTAALARDFARGNQNLALGEGEFEFVGVAPSTSSPPLASESQSQSKAVGARDSKKKETETDTNSAPPPLLPMLRRRKDTATTSESPSTSGPGASFFPFIFECQLLPESVVDVYDHSIVVGTVVRAITSSGGAEVGTSSEDLCLTYANTRFWEVGKEVV